MARPGLKQHPKFLRLCHLLRCPVPHALGYLECLWDVAYQSGNPRLGDATGVELAAQWPGEAGVLAAALLECRVRPDGAGFIEETAPGQYQVRDLLDHAPEYVAGRASREAERSRAKVCSVCQAVYRSPDHRSKYCSPRCRTARWRDRDDNPVTDLVTDCDGGGPRKSLQDKAVTDAVTDCDGLWRTVTERDGTPAPAPAPAPQGRGKNPPTTPACPEPALPASRPPATHGARTKPAVDDPAPPKPAVDDPVLLTFPVVGKGAKEWCLRQSKAQEYREAFPGLDVLAESRKALQWCRDNPAKRKTPRGMPAFLWRWLEREQNQRGGSYANGQGRPGRDPGGGVGPTVRVGLSEQQRAGIAARTIRAGAAAAEQSAVPGERGQAPGLPAAGT